MGGIGVMGGTEIWLPAKKDKKWLTLKKGGKKPKGRVRSDIQTQD